MIDGFVVASLPKIIAELVEERSFLVFENVDIDVEKKLLNLKPVNQGGSGGLLGAIKGFFFHRIPSADQMPEVIKKEHFVVNIKVLDSKVIHYSSRDCQLLRDLAFREKLFLTRQEMVDFFDRQKEDPYDAYLIIHALVERKLLHEKKNKDEYGRPVKGYIIHDPDSSAYKVNHAIFQVQKSIQFIDNKIDDLENEVRVKHDKILDALKHKSKEIAKTLGREKLKTEKQIVFLLNKKSILSDKLDEMKDSLHNNLPEEVWKISRELTEKRLLDLDDIQEALTSMNELKEKDRAVYEQMGADQEEEDAELQKELEKIEAEMVLKPLTSPYKSRPMDTEFEANLLNNPFPTTQKKPDSTLNPLLANLGSNQGTQLSFFGNKFGVSDTKADQKDEIFQFGDKIQPNPFQTR